MSSRLVSRARLSALVLGVWYLGACASAEPPEAPEAECLSNADCPGGVCDRELGICQRVEPQPDLSLPDMMQPQDMPGDMILILPDMDPVEDMPADMITDMLADMSQDMRPMSDFSGCTADAQCNTWQTCNVALGRCQDARSLCQDDSTCSGGARCGALLGGLRPGPARLSGGSDLRADQRDSLGLRGAV